MIRYRLSADATIEAATVEEAWRRLASLARQIADIGYATELEAGLWKGEIRLAPEPAPQADEATATAPLELSR